MRPNTQKIKLSQALPWLSQDGLAGFVTELDARSLKLKHCDEHHSFEPDKACQLTILLSESQKYHISGKCDAPFSGTQSFWVSDTEAQTKLIDLLGQIRKEQHIELCQSEDVEASDHFTGFDDFSLLPEALPDLNLDELDTSRQFLGYRCHYPILITGMTGGVARGTEINRRLARAASHFKIPMGIGSQRIALENPDYAAIFNVKRHAPDLFLIGNLGFAQLRHANYLDLCQRAVDMIEADALAIHVNVIQEAVQVEGDRHFQGLLDRIANVAAKLSVPLLVKEVGCGMAPATCRKLQEAGVAAIDIGGKGGTSWGYIEGLRSADAQTQKMGQLFRDWGIPTAYSLAACHDKGACTVPLIATGGIRDGLTIAKAVGLGATLVGVGLPLLRAALEHEDGPIEVLSELIRALKIAMLASGSQSLGNLEQSLCLGKPYQQSCHHRFLEANT